MVKTKEYKQPCKYYKTECECMHFEDQPPKCYKPKEEVPQPTEVQDE